MSALIEVKKQDSKKIIVYNVLKEEIIQNKIPPGTPLVERQICDALNTSRTPVREAFQRLEYDGFVETIPGRGVIVTELSVDDLIEIYDIRIALECLSVERCIESISDTELLKIKQIVDNMALSMQHQEYKEYIRLDRLFHELIVINSNNLRLKKLIDNMSDHIRRITYLIYGDTERMKLSIEQHLRIYEGIKQKNVEKAVNAVKVHLESAIAYHEIQLKRSRERSKKQLF